MSASHLLLGVTIPDNVREAAQTLAKAGVRSADVNASGSRIVAMVDGEERAHDFEDEATAAAICVFLRVLLVDQHARDVHERRAS